ncbi:hypothetical protein RSOLAG1IB_06760 [Rhizoctonia solani AG-1 IB]|uniref:Glucose-methanol-choline oxidoreductase C-terminal domain-containing protein n=1 Tax=Thanatephorus cucumeris (strain AG1-IB / isolate 7/3/14) TaxID=1108050 RepID=A0A0B7F7M1_THACB|nr:hypothetical protein RSOLAG1IB_06760 [Rhizoctonia solani AG-1 IB]
MSTPSQALRPGYGVYRIKLASKSVWLDGHGSWTELGAFAQTTGENQWIVYPVNATEQGDISFRIAHFDGTRILTWEGEDLRVRPSRSSYTTWNIEADKKGLRISTEEKPEFYLQVNSQGGTSSAKLVKASKVDDAPYSGLEFERLDIPVPPDLAWSAVAAATGETFQQKFFNLTLKEAAWEQYDIIIVGSGIGGGVLANDLYDTNSRLGKDAKRILLLEKGGLVFHSHCLNTARPAGLAHDRGQQNDTFFQQFKQQYDFEGKLEDEDKIIPGSRKHSEIPKQYPWSGGAMYGLGGRSAAWGLFAPRVHDKVLEEKYHPTVYKDLRGEYYDKAERLMLVSLPTTRREHQHIMDRLNSKHQEIDPSVQWQWGRIASEFKDDKNFDFAEGAYCSIDKILEIAMSRPKLNTKGSGKEVDDVLGEHKYFKTVLNADVQSLEFDKGIVTGVKVKGPNNEVVTIKVRNPGEGEDNGKVVLSAGSVHSPTILLRSDHTKDLLREERFKALHLTDHSILFFQASFRYTDPSKREELGAMKLQTHALIDNERVLFNMSVDASSFLPRGKSSDPKLPKFIFVVMCQADLDASNSITLTGQEQKPVIRLKPRNMNLSGAKMRQFILAAMKALTGSAGLEFVGFEDLKVDSKPNDAVDKKFLEKIDIGFLPLGGVAHELGTLPMVSKLDPVDDYCLDSNLRVRPEICKGVYVCDLSCLPHSPAANPTLTLAALAIRLSRHLNKRLRVVVKGDTYVHAVNQSGSKVKVFLSHHKPDEQSGSAEKALILESGQDHYWERPKGVPQGLFIYRLDMASTEEKFLDRPVVLVAHPGKVTSIMSDISSD